MSSVHYRAAVTCPTHQSGVYYLPTATANRGTVKYTIVIKELWEGDKKGCAAQTDNFQKTHIESLKWRETVRLSEMRGEAQQNRLARFQAINFHLINAITSDLHVYLEELCNTDKSVYCYSYSFFFPKQIIQEGTSPRLVVVFVSVCVCMCVFL